MATVTNFGNENLPMMNVDVVMTSYEKDEPSPFFELEFLDGKLAGQKMVMGEFDFSCEDGEDDGEVSYSVAFEDKTKDENDTMVADNVELIRTIATSIMEEVVRLAEEDLEEYK